MARVARVWYILILLSVLYSIYYGRNIYILEYLREIYVGCSCLHSVTVFSIIAGFVQGTVAHLSRGEGPQISLYQLALRPVNLQVCHLSMWWGFFLRAMIAFPSAILML
jgi:hypothetical protein